MKRTAEAKMGFLGTGMPVRLHFRNDLHLARKVWHMTMGLVIAFVYLLSGMEASTGVLILGSVLGVALMVETARLRNPVVNDRVVKLWGPVMRHSEVSRMTGVPSYVLASLLAIGIFPKPVAVLSILYLACGDPLASLFGILYGHLGRRFKNGKSMIGTLAGVITCMIVSFVFLNMLALPFGTLVILSLIGGIAGGTAELLPLEMDDNFTIPVVSGFALWLGFIALGI